MADEGKAAEGKGLVVVTGASGGIGAAIAKGFSAQGHPLLLLARRTGERLRLGVKWRTARVSWSLLQQVARLWRGGRRPGHVVTCLT